MLVAPPGAGKTTRVPLVLLDEPWAKDKKILVLEPRRLAARAAAARMASTLGEQVGDTVGLRVRFGSKISKRTRIEVVTEGMFTRLILDDPSLDGIAAVLFDEFHERSLDADLGLALARDAQQGLREDLKILVMSATLDGARVAALLGDAPVIESEGRAFPVETRYLGRDPRAPHRARRWPTRCSARCAPIPARCWCFCRAPAKSAAPKRCCKERVGDPNVDIVALYGALDAREQDRAISPAPPGRRKVVLATSIAETSLTIEGVRVVIDSGLSRVPRYEPDVGLTRLETVRVSRAAADQRRGRAGRTEPGVCYRLWDEPQTGSLEPYTRPEILSADLSGFVLDLAQWGASDPGKLAFLDPPPAAALTEAKALLAELGAIDAQGRITDEGRKLRQLPLPPRLARMVVDAAAEGAGDAGRGDRRDPHRARARRRRCRSCASARSIPPRPLAPRRGCTGDGEAVGETAGGKETGSGESVGSLLALAYPDRIAKSRGGGTGAFLLANGRGGKVDPASALAREPFLAVAELTGTAAASRIMLAAPITLAEIEARFAGKIEDRDAVTFDASFGVAARAAQPPARRAGAGGADQAGRARRRHRTNYWPRASRRSASTGCRGARRSCNCATACSSCARRKATNGPISPTTRWRASPPTGWRRSSPARPRCRKSAPTSCAAALDALLPWTLRKRLDAEAPTHFTAPSGSAVPIDYEAEQGPTVSIRVQELFGLAQHPSIAGGRVPLVIELLSPAHRPVQVTRDLPGFWRGSYADVKTEMRGRYPAPSLAGRSADGAADPPRQAARRIEFSAVAFNRPLTIA